MKPKHRRALWLALAFLSVAAGAAGILTVFRDNIVFFFSPSEVMAKGIGPEKRIRVGGLVVKDSIVREGAELRFLITDTATVLAVRYEGLPPNLFKEGIGIVAEGHMQGGHFQATQLLAKHDERYMPPEVTKALKDAGHWKDQYDGAKAP